MKPTVPLAFLPGGLAVALSDDPIARSTVEADGQQCVETNLARTIRGNEDGDYAIVRQGADRVIAA